MIRHVVPLSDVCRHCADVAGVFRAPAQNARLYPHHGSTPQNNMSVFTTASTNHVPRRDTSEETARVLFSSIQHSNKDISSALNSSKCVSHLKRPVVLAVGWYSMPTHVVEL
mmetsp:Transcript_40154/g.106518  ORF Transcript_40154/g.106518 Transcript_40154/m.106518 type:complete len:112 (-) Transcript_40154:139-474(-)